MHHILLPDSHKRFGLWRLAPHSPTWEFTTTSLAVCLGGVAFLARCAVALLCPQPKQQLMMLSSTGIEERMHILWDVMVNSGKITPMDYVRLTSTACAQIFNIYPRKGAIVPGSDADIILLNPNATNTISASSHHSRIDTNIYEGWTMKGKVEMTISRGRVVWENEKLNISPGSGRYIPLPPFGYLFHGLDKLEAAYISSLRAPKQSS